MEPNAPDVPSRWLAPALIGFFAVLAFYFAVVEGPGRINHDMSEAYAWGREFQLGYHQHPPFWAWICGLWFLVFPHSIESFGVLSALNATLGLWGLWRVTGAFVDGPRRTAALALGMLTPCYSLMAFKYNANTIFISLWPWTLSYFLAALGARRLGVTIGFGVFVGLMLLSKYYAVVPLSVCLWLSLTSEHRTAYWRSFSPYLSGAIALALFAPHLVWLAENRAPPIQYLASMSGLSAAEMAHYLGNSGSGVLLMIAPAAIVAAVLARPKFAAILARLREPRVRILALLTLWPIALTFLAAVILRTRLSAEMMVGMLPLWPLLCIELAAPANAGAFAGRAKTIALAGVAALAVAAFPVSYATARWSARADEVAPYREVALAAEKAWRETTSAPLRYVAGFDAYDQAAAFYAADRPHAFINFDFAFSAWVNPQALARYGLLSICPIESAPCLERADHWGGSQARRLDVEISHLAWGHATRPFRYRITITPPAS